jgi:hypothetical protein
MRHQGISSSVKIYHLSHLVLTIRLNIRAVLLLPSAFLLLTDWSTHTFASATGRSVVGAVQIIGPLQAPLLDSITAASHRASLQIFPGRRLLARAVYAARLRLRLWVNQSQNGRKCIA